MQDFRKALSERVLVLDGALGTMLQRKGALAPGACPEALNLDHPDPVIEVLAAYAAAGCEAVVTNTFGASPIKLAEFGLEGKVREINGRGVEQARRAAAGKAWVGGSIGPSGRFARPIGDAVFAELYLNFKTQAEALLEAGPDFISLETFGDIKEARAALMAVRDLSDIPVIAMMTFETDGRTVLGTPPEAAAAVFVALGADVVGTNCGMGPSQMLDIIKRMADATRLPLIAQANAGLPVLREGRTVFPATPEEMAAAVRPLAEAGARVISGCCGTTPDHMRAVAQAVKSLDLDLAAIEARRAARNGAGACRITSRTRVSAAGRGLPLQIIGERINPTGKKKLAAALAAGDMDLVRRLARDQAAAGADILDVNVGAPGINEAEAMTQAVLAADGAQAPLCIDSSSPRALEAGLAAAAGKSLVNSVNGDPETLERVLPIVQRYGAAVIGLTLDEKGIPGSVEERVALARRIVQAAEVYGINKRDLLIDCLTLAVSAEPGRAAEGIETVWRVTDELGVGTVMGVSNVSFGLPHRTPLNAAYLAMCASAGLSAAIVNPSQEEMMAAVRAARVLAGTDPRGQSYSLIYGEEARRSVKREETRREDLSPLDRVREAVIHGERDSIVGFVEAALKAGVEPLSISSEALVPGLDEVGRRYDAREYFLPQMILAAEAMQEAFARLKQELKGELRETLGRVVLATVEGDVHDIGKNIVATLLANNGFEVTDLGKSVKAAEIVERARELGADVVGLSALMTTTMSRMPEVIEEAHRAGLGCLFAVGGAVVTEKHARDIGAEIYASDAMEAVKVFKEALRKKKEGE